MTSRSSALLVHIPLGDENPFQPEPAERIPRYPTAGEEVILGVQTKPGGCFSKVGATWRTNEEAAILTASGNLVSSEADTDHWQVKLPSFSGGDWVYYRIHGESEAHHFETEWFSFCVMDWVRMERFFLLGDKDPTLLLSDAAGKLLLRFGQGASENGTLTFQISRYEIAEGTQAASLDQAASPQEVEIPDRYKVEGKEYEITFSNHPFRFELLRKSDGVSLRSCSAPEILLDGDGEIVRLRLDFESPESEAFYGFGERFNALDQRGWVLENRVIDTYTQHGAHSYFPVPFFLSSRGYGVWIDSDQWMKFDLARGDPHAWQIESEVKGNQDLEIRFFLQASPYAILQEFTRQIGRAPMPPAWVFGLWMSSNDWNSQAEVMRQLELAKEHEIPATVLVIEAWSDEATFYIWNGSEYTLKPASDGYRYSDFTFPTGGYWSDPKGMIEEIHKAGMRFILWQIPVIKKCGPEEADGLAQNMADGEFAIREGYCVRKSDGAPYRVLNYWFHDGLLIDFSNPRAADWWLSKRRYLVEELGVDGFKTDGGEHLWEHAARLHDGTTGWERINSYTRLYLSAYDHFLRSLRGEDGVLFSRAGYTGTQRHSCYWTGDDLSTWEAFRASILAMLNMGISGMPFIGWDIAGFSGEIPSSELYLRAAAFSALCPIMQYHSDSNYRRKPSRDRTPWNIQERTRDQRVIPIFRQFTNLRMNLLPYLLSQAWQCAQTGLPLMRALPIEFPGDLRCRDFPYQYLLGDALLVAPVLEEGKKSLPVYFPEGEWRELWTVKSCHGPVLSEVSVPLDRIAVYQRKGTVLPLNLGEDWILCSPVGNRVDRYLNLHLLVYSDEDCQAPLYQNGENRGWVRCQKDIQGSGWSIELPPLECPVRISLFEVQAKEVQSDAKTLPQATDGNPDPEDHAWKFSPAENMTRIDLPIGAQSVKVTVGL